jgi:hypothetical protein
MFFGAFLGRVPYAMESIGTVVFMKSSAGGFAVAGLVAGAVSGGIALGAVVQGRRADSGGAATLIPLAVAHVVAMGTLLELGSRGVSAAILAVVGLAVGVTVPPTSSILRTAYPSVLANAPQRLRAAFALDSALTDVTYVAGPTLVSIGVLVASPSAALVAAALAALTSAVVLIVRGPQFAPRPRERRSSRLSALAAPGIRTLTLATLPLGAAFGAWEVAYPAYGSARGDLALGGLVLSLAAIASSAASLVYGARSSRNPANVLVRHGVWVVPMFALPAAATSVPAVALLTIPAGLVIGPWTVARNQLTGPLAAPGTLVEAYAWQVTALLVGTAVGTAIAGVLIDHTTWQAACVLSSGIAVLGALIALNGHRHLVHP